MRRFAAIALLVAAAACRQAPDKVDTYEWTDTAAAEVADRYPGAVPLPDQTDLVRRAQLAANPALKQSPTLGVFESADPIEVVASFYATRYGVLVPAISTGDIHADAVALAPLLAKIGVRSDPAAVSGAYRAAVIRGNAGRPSVSLQRPYRDALGNRVVDRTLILLTRQ